MAFNTAFENQVKLDQPIIFANNSRRVVCYSVCADNMLLGITPGRVYDDFIGRFQNLSRNPLR